MHVYAPSVTVETPLLRSRAAVVSIPARRNQPSAAAAPAAPAARVHRVGIARPPCVEAANAIATVRGSPNRASA
jgi:hypothetical protein